MIAQQQGGRVAVIAVGRFQQRREAAAAELVLEAAVDSRYTVFVVCTHDEVRWHLLDYYAPRR